MILHLACTLIACWTCPPGSCKSGLSALQYGWLDTEGKLSEAESSVHCLLAQTSNSVLLQQYIDQLLGFRGLEEHYAIAVEWYTYLTVELTLAAPAASESMEMLAWSWRESHARLPGSQSYMAVVVCLFSFSRILDQDIAAAEKMSAKPQLETEPV